MELCQVSGSDSFACMAFQCDHQDWMKPFEWSPPNQSTYMQGYLYFSFHVCHINNTVHIPHVQNTSAC